MWCIAWRSLKALLVVLTGKILVCFRLVERQARTPAKRKPRQYHARLGRDFRLVIDFCWRSCAVESKSWARALPASPWVGWSAILVDKWRLTWRREELGLPTIRESNAYFRCSSPSAVFTGTSRTGRLAMAASVPRPQSTAPPSSSISPPRLVSEGVMLVRRGEDSGGARKAREFWAVFEFRSWWGRCRSRVRGGKVSIREWKRVEMHLGRTPNDILYFEMWAAKCGRVHCPARGGKTLVRRCHVSTSCFSRGSWACGIGAPNTPLNYAAFGRERAQCWGFRGHWANLGTVQC